MKHLEYPHSDNASVEKRQRDRRRAKPPESSESSKKSRERRQNERRGVGPPEQDVYDRADEYTA